MSDIYGLKITVETDYGESGKYRHTLERDSSYVSVYDWMDMLRNITVSVGYSDEQWKRGVINMAGEYEEEVKPLKPMKKGPFKITDYEPFKNTAYLEQNDN